MALGVSIQDSLVSNQGVPQVSSPLSVSKTDLGWVPHFIVLIFSSPFIDEYFLKSLRREAISTQGNKPNMDEQRVLLS